MILCLVLSVVGQGSFAIAQGETAPSSAESSEANPDTEESGDKETEPTGKVDDKADGQADGKGSDPEGTVDDKSGDQNGKTDGKSDDKTDGKTDGKTDDKTDGKTDGKTEGKTDGKTDGNTDSKTDTKDEGKQELTKQVTTSDGATYDIRVSYTADAGIPTEGVELLVSEILSKDDGYDFYVGESAKKLGTDAKGVSNTRVFRISIADVKDSERIYKPSDKVNVTIRLAGTGLDASGRVEILRFEEKNTRKGQPAKGFSTDSYTVEEMDCKVDGGAVEFSADSLAVYVVTQKIQKIIEASDGNTYRITVEYDAASGIPADAELAVSEVEDKEYAAYLAEAAKAVGADVHSISYGKLFNIAILKDGVEYQPDNAVTVTIELLDADKVSDVQVVHFEKEDKAEKLSASTDGSTVTFETEGFSVFSFLDFSLIDLVVNAALGEKKGVLYENDDIILTGKMPSSGIVEATRVDVAVDGQDALVAYDIKIYSNALMKSLGINWQPGEGAIKVTVKSKSLDSKLVNVYHMETVTSEPELVAEEVAVEDNSVTFDADSFSVYALTPETYHRMYRFFTLNEDGQYVEYTLFTDQGTTTYTQIIKEGDSLIVPQLPSIPNSSVSTFAGWFVGTGDVSVEPIDPASITMSETPFDFDNIPPITVNGEEVCLFAKFADFAYVIFHDQYNGSTGTFPVAMTRRGEKVNNVNDTLVATIQIGDVTVAYDDSSDENTETEMAFFGWSYTPITTAGSSVDDAGNPISRIDSESINTGGTVHLYPIFLPIHWLSYYTGPAGAGSTYIPSKYYYVEEGPTSLPVPVRSGYTFLGWWVGSVEENEALTYGEQVADASGALIAGVNDTTYGASVANGKLLLTKDVHLIAKWEADQIQYTVLYWIQNPDDDEYSLAGYDTKTGESGSLTEATANWSPADESNRFFHVSEDQDKETEGNQADIVQQIISGNGDTAVNVYYDRNVYKLWLMIGADGGNGYYYIKTTANQIGNASGIHNVFNTTTGAANTGWERFSSNNIDNPFVSEVYPIETETSQYTSGGTTRTITYYYIAVTARYGGSLEGKWPTNGIGHQVNGRNFNSWQMTTGTYLRDHSSTQTIKGLFPVMSYEIITYNNVSTPITGDGNTFPAGVTNILVGCYPTNTSYSYTYRYYLWDPKIGGYPSEPITVATSATSQASSATIASFDGYEYVEKTYGEDGQGSGNSQGGIVNFYYMPEQYNLTFMYNGTKLGEDTYYYTQNLTNANKYRDDAEAVMPLGYSFAGWYENPNGAGDPFDFSTATMPMKNIILYPYFETIWYLIKIDPNGGSGLDSDKRGSTWFWEPYSGDPIEEYTWITRDYVESRDGTFYYVVHDRDYYGYSDEWVSGEAADRSVYYTEDPGEATNLTTYKYAENAYRYAGWYEVLYDDQGNEIGEVLYSFGDPVTHNTTLRLHWKKIGTYYVSYDPGRGTIDSGDNNEELFFELDGDDYADNAEVVVSRTANAPEGYNFVGWVIRGNDDGVIYYPGDTFVFKAKDAVTVNGKETIFLDAVYTRVKTAEIIYDANGGSIDPETIDFGNPIDAGAPEPSTSCDAAAGTATIGNMVNNTEVRLSDGTGFSKANATLVGWSTEPNFNPDTDTLFALGKDPGNGTIPTYYVDTEEPVKLYAVWQVKVYFHLNEAVTNANFGGTWDATVYTLEADDLYSTVVYLNNPVEQPATDPVFYNADNPQNLFFHYWGTMRYAGDDIEAYDFSQTVTDELHLYAYWAGPIRIPVHAVDATDPTLVDRDADWLTTQPQTLIEIAASEVSLSAKSDAAVYAANVTSEYDYAFAAIKSRTADLQTISEDDAIAAVYYNSAAKKVYVRYMNAGRADAPLADTDEVYLVYFKEPLTLNIGYKVMDMTGAMNDASLKNNAGNPTTAPLGTFVMNNVVTGPLSYKANDANYLFYSYAIGAPNATNASQLQLITNSSNSDSSRPSLQVRNTWRGIKYSTDGGNTWLNCGYDGTVQLYVVYFETDSQPSVVTINEKTIGMAADMGEEFAYTVTIVTTTTTETVTQRRTRTRRNAYSNWGNWSSYSTLSTDEDSESTETETSFMLTDGMQQAETLFYRLTSTQNEGATITDGNTQSQDRTVTTITTTQTIVITQTAKTGYVTDNAGTEGTSTDDYIWTFTTADTPATPSVTYTNTHTPLTVEVHVALIGGSGITLDDADRAATYTITLPIDRPADSSNEKVFLTELPAATLFTGDSAVYGFAGIVYGTSGINQGDTVTMAGTDVRSILYGQLYPGDDNRDNIYEMMLKDSASDVLDQLGEYKIYYLYYPLPKVVYVKETAGGALERIQGSTDGTNVTNSITYNGAALQFNGVTVMQEQLLPVTEALFTISQTVGTGIFNMPPKLDDGTKTLFLNYTKLGVAGSVNVTNSNSLTSVTESKEMYLKVDGTQLKWSLNGTSWNAFSDSAPTVYAIYKEIGYDLQITKTLSADFADPTQTFTLTVSSHAITESSYAVTGTGYATISATPASGFEPGRITLTIRDGSDITISGLAEGSYTVSESAGAVMSAEIDGVSQAVLDNTVVISLDKNTKLDLLNENEVQYVAPTGYHTAIVPFLAILLAGLVFLCGGMHLVLRKKREDR